MAVFFSPPLDRLVFQTPAFVPFKVQLHQSAFRFFLFLESHKICSSHDLLTFLKRTLFTRGSTLLLRLSMLIKFLCSLIKRIESASAAGCYMASWIHAHTHTHKHAHTEANTHFLCCNAHSYPSQLTAC